MQEQLDVPKDLMNKILEEGRYTAPTPIQMQAVPALFTHKNVIGIAETGSGKSLSFILPLLSQIISQPGEGI